MFEHQRGHGPAVNEDQRRECLVGIACIGLPWSRGGGWDIVPVEELGSIKRAVKARHLDVDMSKRDIGLVQETM